MLFSHDRIEQCSPEILSELQSKTLSCFLSNSHPSLRSKLSHLISALSSHFRQAQMPWPQLSQLLADALASPDHTLREYSLEIIASDPELCQNTHLLLKSLQDPHIEVRLAALKASCYFLLATEPSIRDSLQETMMPFIFQTFPILINLKDRQELLQSAFSYLTELAEVFPKLFKPTLSPLIDLIVQIISDLEYESSTQQAGLELLLTIMEAAPSLMKKQSSFVSSIVPLMIQWMSDLEDEEDWYTTLNVEEDDDESGNDVVGEQAMDRLARGLGGAIMLPIAFSMIPGFLSSPEWTKRHAGLRAISAIGEGCHSIMVTELDKVVA
jgi:hypothetical protein